MEQASFNESISSGGLRTIADIKLLVCYLLKKIDAPMTRTQMCEVLQENDTANYFEANQAISELIKNGKLFCELSGEQELLSITPQVKYDVMQIETTLPKTLRERSVAAALKVLSRDRIERESKVEVEKTETGYYVTFVVEDVGVELLRLKVYVADLSQVELVKRNFFSNAVGIYSDIISSLTVE